MKRVVRLTSCFLFAAACATALSFATASQTTQVSAPSAAAIDSAPVSPAIVQAAAPALAYDVVSIKPDKSNGPYSSWWKTNGDGFSANVPVRNLILGAYNLTMMDQISGLPQWAESEQFDIDAKMDADTMAAFNKLPKEERGKQDDLMMQTMLAERFNLRVRRETKQLPIYALVIAKGGSKLKESPANGCGGYTMGMGKIKGNCIQLESLAYSLAGTVGRLIVNRTGLNGKYDGDLTWSLEDGAASADAGPSIFTALEEQMGLKLEPTKGPVDTIVIEHIERPTAN